MIDSGLPLLCHCPKHPVQLSSSNAISCSVRNRFTVLTEKTTASFYFYISHNHIKKRVLNTKGIFFLSFLLPSMVRVIIFSFMGLLPDTPQELWIFWGLCGHIMNRIFKKRIAKKLKWKAPKDSEEKISLCFHLNVDLLGENILWKVLSMT